MGVALYQGQDHQKLTRVTKRLRDESGNPIGRRHDNPFLDSRLYEVEFSDGEKMLLAGNAIAENVFAQVDEKGYCRVIMDYIIDLSTGRNRVSKDDAFLI